MIDELVQSVFSILQFIQLIINANYAIVTTIFTTLYNICNGIYLLCESVYFWTSNALLVVFDFIIEIWNSLLTVGSFLTWLVAGLWNIFNVLLCITEQCIINIYCGIISTISLVIQLITSTTNFTLTLVSYIFSIVAIVISSIYNALVFIGNCVTQGASNTVVFTITSAFNAISSIFYAIQNASDYIHKMLSKAIEFLHNIPSDVYIGVLVLIGVYYVLDHLFRYMYHNGLTFPSFVFTQSLIVDDNLNVIQGDDDDDDVSVYDDDGEQQEPEDSEDDNWNDIDVDLPGTSRRHEATPSPAIEIDHNSSKAQLKNALEKERDKKLCVVCQDQQKTVLVMPCKHLCLCIKCARQILKADFLHRRVCPLCRGNIETIMNVYT